MSTLRILSWNLLGRKKPDTHALAQWIENSKVDVACLQEVQNHQLRSIRHDTGLRHLNWSFKHWGFRSSPEGLGILSKYDLDHFDAHVISEGARPWSYHRRIMQMTEIRVNDTPVLIVNVHLSYSNPDQRAAQLAKVFSHIDHANVAPHYIIAGDLNMTPEDKLFEVFKDRDLKEVWSSTHDEPALTNWRGNEGGARIGPPQQQLDYLWISDGLRATDCTIPKFGDNEFDSLARLSDHLPVTATLEWS